MTDFYENNFYQQIFKFSIEIVEKQEKMLMKAIQEIGGTQYEHITVDKSKVVQALRNATVQKVDVKTEQEKLSCGIVVKIKSYICPQCKKELLYDEQNYCGKCGQAIDRSEDDAEA